MSSAVVKNGTSSACRNPPKSPELKPSKLQDSIHSLLELETHTPAVVGGAVCETKQGSSVRNTGEAGLKQATFGSRLLTDPAKVDDFNAWDHVEWDDTHLANAAERIAYQKAHPVSDDVRQDFGDAHASEHWDKFYGNHEEGFFKDRKWIRLEFPELIECTTPAAGPRIIADLGCAVGNTVFPLLRMNQNPKLVIHALDFSSEAIKIVKASAEYDESVVNANVWDIADSNGSPAAVKDGTVDVIVLIFAFSALSPGQWPIAMSNLHRMLKPGGLLLLRDYGRYDLTQLRLKANRLLSDSFYIRGDGTRVYYFTNEELEKLFCAQAGWNLEQNAIDKRLLVNRKEGKHMYRAWVQVKARKV